MLKQLPDVGANNTPRALRKDVWRPFFILSMPEGEVGAAQGLLAYKHLREWRKLHEVNWEVSPLMARPHSKEEIDAMQKELDNRGGSKKENVWDLVKRAKKKMRVHTVMNQKANSVADLAVVLQDLNDLGKRTAREQIAERQEDRRKEIEKMLELAKQHEDGGLEKLQQEIDDLERQLENSTDEVKDTSKGKLKFRLRPLERRVDEMLFAVEAVANAKSGKSIDSTGTEIREPTTSGLRNELDTEVEPAKRAGLVTAGTENAVEGAADPTTLPAESRRDAHILANGWQHRLPSFPTPDELPKRKLLHNKLKDKRHARPIFNTSNVEIRWDNVLDAEFAKSWPEEVSHLSMGYARHTAPDPEDEPVAGAAELRARIQDRKNAAILPKSEMEVYAETLQNEILEKMKAEVLEKQDRADLVAAEKNRIKIRAIGRQKKTVKKTRRREKEAMGKEDEALVAPVEV